MEHCFEDCKFHKPVFLFGRLNIKILWLKNISQDYNDKRNID